ncbi:MULTISPECIES: class I ribonucleotide reductase maintenance protein YfaE [unclassified Aliivibrio]|uniref:class I ribonucleotide reductase maintenance protein YfaE n=1 Tax=unclassified Aliivibrio TaxID=2645654 RepID=UPI00080DC61E|nr:MULTISPECIES: class I ribonucleotide reductase maintenance protein YfaE [unclassified Aliivibrio]OCH15707.1 (Fe-S)-binding protein [Aliivibrio sp. 1S128]OCH18311.1 (Fe-S)-binding protein [Aliivibrio sp. 1S165]OCH35688.1 (Fe-S)-binding protein [Aliivibrio sp. 1S175]
MTKIRINKVITLDNKPNLSLLEIMEDKGMIIESHCRNGDCGTCRCTLVSGEISYLSFPLAFLAPNEILPCVCKVESDLVIEGVNFQFSEKKA